MKHIEGRNSFLNESIDSDIVIRLYKIIKELYKTYGDRKKNINKTNFRKLVLDINPQQIAMITVLRFELLTQIAPDSYVVKVDKNVIDDLEKFTINLYLKVFVTKHRKTYATISKISKLTAMLDKEAEKKAKYKKPIVDKEKAKQHAIKAKNKKDLVNITAMIQFLDSVIDDNNVESVRLSFRMLIQRNNLSIAKYLEFMLNNYVRINGDKYEILPKFTGMSVKKIAENIYEEL